MSSPPWRLRPPQVSCPSCHCSLVPGVRCSLIMWAQACLIVQNTQGESLHRAVVTCACRALTVVIAALSCSSTRRDGLSWRQAFVQAWVPLEAGTVLSAVRLTGTCLSVAGAFTMPPATAEVALQPDIHGSSAAGSFVVCAAVECTADELSDATAAAADAVPNDCPGDCSGAGSCAVASGTCDCMLGALGASCAESTR